MIALRCCVVGLCALLCSLANIGFAQTVRIATFNTELSRDGPGLFLRDVLRGEAEDILNVARTISVLNADILTLQGIDWDQDQYALKAFIRRIAENGTHYPYWFTSAPNSAFRVDTDLDGDGKTGGPGDAQGYGRFSGQGGMAVLSRFPIKTDNIQDFSSLLWRDLPGATLPTDLEGAPFPSAEAQRLQRLSDTNHWQIPITLPNGEVLTLLAFQAGPPVFDGPEDRNGRRTADEIRLWSLVINGQFASSMRPPFVVLGGANTDPDKGEGRKAALVNLLNNPRLQDPEGERSKPNSATATVLWTETGPMRVDYVLPSADLSVLQSGVLKNTDLTHLETGSRHMPVWVDIDFAARSEVQKSIAH